jgi:hypothetical protein
MTPKVIAYNIFDHFSVVVVSLNNINHLISFSSSYFQKSFDKKGMIGAILTFYNQKTIMSIKGRKGRILQIKGLAKHTRNFWSQKASYYFFLSLPTHE